MVMDQLAEEPRPAWRKVLFGAPVGAIAGALAGAMIAPWAIPIGGAVGGVATGGIGPLLETLLRARLVGRARLVVAERRVRVFRPGNAPSPALLLEVPAIAALELVPLDDAATWTLTAIDVDGGAHPLLDTADRTAGLRVRTLLVERLARDGAFPGADLIASPCPRCSARIAIPASWLPTAVACGACGAEGMLTRGA
jgi:hypothetical protein